MSDDKAKVDGRDRSQVSAGDDYEVQHFAEQHGITAEQVRMLISQHGNDRATLERVVRQISA